MPPSSSGVSVATLTATVTADTSDLDAKMGKAGSTVESFGNKVNSATSTTANFDAASATMAAGAAGIALGLADSVMAAGDFQATINEIGAVSGATTSELDQLSAMALQVGKDTAFSAQEGAQAIAELSKAGLTVPDILDGAAMSTANLAAAAGVDMPRAAEIMSNAMNMFRISGEDSARVADVLAGAANTSAASVNDLATGFAQAGPSAAALGLTLEDTAAALALFADRGLSGSDAGTSLKTMLASLTPATKPAKAAMGELGLLTEETGNAFFDAQGNFVGMDQAADLLYDSLKDLTDQQRAQYLETIFGSDASRAAELMFQAQKSAAEGTGRGYDDYRAAVEASGQATDVAEAKMKGMNGAIEALKGSIETAQIVLGTTFVGAIEFAADALSTIVNTFLNLPGPVQTAIAGVTAGAAAFLAVGSAIGFIIGPLGAFTAALAPMAAGILAIAAPLALVTAAIAAFAIAYKTNFLGFGDAVDSVVAKVTTFASQFGQIFDLFSNGSDAASGLTQRIEGFGAAVEFMTGLPVASFFSGIASALDEAGNHFASITGRISELMGAGFTPLQAAVRALREEFPAFSGAIATVGTLFQNLLDTVSGVASGLMSAFDALRNGDLSGVFQGLLAAGQAAVTGLLNSFQILGGGVLQAFSAIDWSAISATLLAGLQNASNAFQQWFGAISQNLQTWFTSIDWGVIGGMLSTGLQTAITAIGDVASFLLPKGAELIAGLVQGITDHLPDVGTKLGEIATGAGAVLPDALTLLLQKGADLIAGLVQGIGDHLPDVATKLGELATSATGVLPDALTLLVQKGADLVAGLVQGIGDHLPDIATKLGEIGTSLADVLPDAVTLLASKGSDLMAGLLQGITEKWPEVDAWLAAMSQDITETIGDLAQLLVAKGSDLMTGLKAGIDAKWPEVDSWLAALPQDIADTVGDLAQTLVDHGTEAIAGLKQGIDSAWPEVEAWLASVTELASTAVGDLTESIKAHGTELITGLSTGAQDFWTGTVEPWLASIASLATTAVGDLASTLMASGQALLQGLATGALDIWNNQLGPWLQSLPGMIVSAVGDLSGVLVQAGASIISGLISGIQSMIPSLDGVLAGVTSRIPIKKGPPTKDAVLLFENGQLIIEGLIDGIKSRIPDLDELLQAITERIQSRFDGTRPYEESGRKAGKGVVEGMNEATGDISDYEVGSAEWRQALQAKITAGMDKVGKKVGDDVNTGVKSKKSDHQKAMGEFLDAGVDYGMDKARDAEDIGVMAANAMRDGLTSSQQTLVTTAGKIATQVIDEFGDRVQAMYDIGKNYMEGFALGMRAGASEVEDAANDIGKSAEKELRKATESQSPSKAAHRVGEDVGRGFADGITSTEDLSAKAAKRLWRAAWNELKDNIKEAGFLGADWAVEFWQGMLDSPNMTGPLAAWITDQMVAAADTALKKIQAQIAGITAQLEIARGLVDAPSSIPEVPQPEPVDTSNRDMLQKQLDATKDLTDAITKAFEKAFSAAHKAHIDFVQGTISESEYLSKYQAAQDAFNAKNANARQVAALEAQVKAAQAAIDAETAARQKAYEQAVKERDAAVAAEKAAREQAVKQLEQAQRDAQMQMTQAVIDESTQRISQYQKELKKTSDPKEKAELKAKIALEKERIDVANQLAGAITAANNATNDFDLSVANAQIEYFTAQLDALGQVDVGGMLQGIADAMLEAANKIAQAADKMKHAFGGGGGGGKNKAEKDKNGGTQDASDPSLGGGGGMGGVTQEFDKVGKAGRKMGDDVNAGSGVASRAIDDLVKRGVISLDTLGAAGSKAGKKMTDGVATAVAQGETHMTKQVDKSVEAATVNGEKIGHDRGKSIGVTITTSLEDGVTSRERNVTKTIDGVVTQSTKSAEKPAKTGGQNVGDQFIYWTSNAVEKGDRDVRRAAKGVMDGAGQEAKKDAHRLGNAAGDDLGRGMADGIRGRKGDVERAARELADAADKASRKKSESRSPSRVWMRHGWDMGDGLVMGLEDRKGDAKEAARALIYTPKGLPGGGSGNSNTASGPGASRGSGTTVNINGPVNLPNVHNPEEFIAWVENLMRTNGVSAGRP